MKKIFWLFDKLCDIVLISLGLSFTYALMIFAPLAIPFLYKNEGAVALATILTVIFLLLLSGGISAYRNKSNYSFFAYSGIVGILSGYFSSLLSASMAVLFGITSSMPSFSQLALVVAINSSIVFFIISMGGIIYRIIASRPKDET